MAGGSRPKAGDAGHGAAIAGLGLCEQPPNDTGEPRRRARRGEEGVGQDRLLLQPVEREIEPAGAGVLADVAGDVAELHGDPEVHRAGEGLLVASAHEQRHHETDRARDPDGIGFERLDRAVAAAVGIPGEALHQCVRDGTWDGVVGHDGGEGAVGRAVRGTAA